MNKKTSRRITLIFNLIILFIFCFFLSDFFGVIGNEKTVKIKIENGDTISGIAQKLKDENIVVSKYMFKTFFKLSEPDEIIKPGEFSVNSKMPYKEIVTRIIKTTNEVNMVTIPEGFTNEEITQRLINNEIIKNADEFKEELKKHSLTLEDKKISGADNSLNGYLFPDTYEFYRNSSYDEIIEKMTSNFKNHWKAEYTQRAQDINMSVNDVIILASIIQREAFYEDDFYTVSSVFHNRLKQGMKLQSCATVQFILNERKDVLSISDTKINSPYNTYINKGLPPTAICSPGELAIKAALYPDESNYIYFFCDKNGETHFSKSLAEHNNLMQKYPVQ